MIFLTKNILTQAHKYDGVNMEGRNKESVENAARCMSGEHSIGRYLQIIIHAVKTFFPPMNSSFFKVIFFFFFLPIILGTRPVWSDLLSDLEVGGTFQLPGSNLSSTLVDKNDDDVVDGIDFDADGLAELAILDIGRDKTVGIDDTGDGSPNFYIFKTKEGTLIIINTLNEKIEVGDNSTSVKQVYIWNDLSITFAGNYSITLGDFADVMPAAFGGTLYIELGLDSLFVGMTELKRHFWFPGLRFAGMYNISNISDVMVSTSWIGIQAGPLWRIQIDPEHRGYFTISPLCGLANLSLHDKRGVRQGFALSVDFSFGYEYRLSDVTFSLNAVSKYLLSEQGIFFQIAAYAGIGYNINL